MKQALLLFIVVLFGFVFTACKSNKETIDEKVEIYLIDVEGSGTVNTPYEIVLNKDEQSEFTLVITPDNTLVDYEYVKRVGNSFEKLDSSATMGLEFTWIVENETFQLNALSKGNYYIRIYNDDVYIIFKVIVFEPPLIDEIEEIVVEEELTLTLGSGKRIEYTALPEHISNKTVTWSSSNPSVVKVDDTGMLFALSNGMAVITLVSNDNPDVFKDVTVTVPEDDSQLVIGSCADASLGNAANETKNYGSTTFLAVASNNTLGRKSIIKYDTTGIINATKATIWLYIYQIDADSSRTIKIYNTSTNWQESTVTWNNAPVKDEFIGEFEFINDTGENDTDGYWFELDVTNYIDYENNGVSILIENDGPISNAGGIYFAPKERVISEHRNRLIVEGAVRSNYESITIDNGELYLEDNYSEKLTVSGTPNAQFDKLIWESSDEEVAIVDKNGVVTAIGLGVATISVYSMVNPNAKDEITVNVIPEYEVDFEKTFRVLSIGNSFSEDSIQYLYEIARDYGVQDIRIGHLVIGGSSLQLHANNALNNIPKYTYNKNVNGVKTSVTGRTILSGLKDENWDFVIVQQVSGFSGIASSFNPDLQNLIDYINVNKLRNHTKVIWHMTWAYQQNSTHGDFWRYYNQQTIMYNEIVSAVQNEILPNSDIAKVIPTGTAIQNLRTSYLGDTLTRDGFHLSYDKGRFTAGMTWFKAISGLSIDDIKYLPSGVTDSDLVAIKEAVNNAYVKPYKITPFS